MYSIKVFVFLMVTIHQAVAQTRNCKALEASLVIDKSGSINTHVETSDYKMIKQLAEDILRKITISQTPLGNRASLVLFSNTAKISDTCDAYSNTDDMIAKVKGLQGDEKDELTNIEDGLRKARESLKSNGCGERPISKVNRAIILISDGKANEGSEDKIEPLFELADDIRAEGIVIIAIAVGTYKIENLIKITGEASLVYLPSKIDDIIKLPVLNPALQCLDFPDPEDECSCNMTSKMPTQFTKYEIIREFEGNCFLDKLKAALAQINADIKKADEEIERIMKCKLETRGVIKAASATPFPTALFEKYENCTENLDCALKRISYMLKEKKSTIEHQIKIEDMGFGSFELSGYMEYLKNRMVTVY